ncbi:MAG: ABC-F family ATP-binding cassette domain-containing protein, partial [Myxococcales bacterium]|nr:ABC-F family ATP-binding cassette domain-containing protein [Myxococcales bacterium]
MIDLTNVSKAYGEQVLYEGLSLRIVDGDRIGLVGANGSGKSTLFKIIVGEMQPDDGSIARSKNLRIGYVHQEVDRMQGGEVLQAVVDSVGDLRELEDEKRHLEELIAEVSDPLEAEHLAKRLGELEERYAGQGGYSIEADARSILNGLGFRESELGDPLSSLSGGWVMRVELARVLLNRPDVLLLDEPTNHLDLESLMWFESYLASFRGSMVIVAHDREFLNRSVDRVVDIDRGRAKLYKGNYDRYLEQKAQDRALQEKRFVEQQQQIKDIEEFVAKNRVRKSGAKRAQSRLKMLEKIERIQVDSNLKRVSFSFPQPERTGKMVIHLGGIDKSYGEHNVFRGLDFELVRGEKVALVGPNGAGKSTLLRILAGETSQDRGERRLGTNVTLDYFAQHQLEVLERRNTVLAEMMTRCHDETISFIRGILGCFLFSGDAVEKTVAALSGGEKSRLALAKMLIRPAALLLLDEPTNHLDIPSREVLEAALQGFTGTVCFVSHDRRFIDAIADRIVEVGGGGAESYPGNYSYYLWKKEQEALAAAEREAELESSRARAIEDELRDGSRDQKREKKRREAEERAERYKRLKPLKVELEAIEGEILAIEEGIGTLEHE